MPRRLAVAQQPFANVRADEARAAGDEKIHGKTLTTGAQSVERGEIGLANFLAQFRVRGQKLV